MAQTAKKIDDLHHELRSLQKLPMIMSTHLESRRFALSKTGQRIFRPAGTWTEPSQSGKGAETMAPEDFDAISEDDDLKCEQMSERYNREYEQTRVQHDQEHGQMMERHHQEHEQMMERQSQEYEQMRERQREQTWERHTQEFEQLMMRHTQEQEQIKRRERYI
ncbi:hypothetical protein CLAIMM_14387 [Cladophialophora immunda]|nr:hypothetical protein CLAIMM_14387 [Cladophialophora immunda]